VAIQLQSGLNVVVPEALTHSFDVDSRFEKQRGVGVTEAVQSDRRHIRLFADPTGEATPDDIGILRRATRPAEDEVQVRAVGRTPRAAIESLPFVLFPQ
jgi:hypothetical protein